jgi:ABC-type multidrug transport system fused ATPase/permease subunit
VGRLQEPGGLSHAVFFGLAIGAVSFLGSICLQHFFLRNLQSSQLAVNALNRLIYQHSLMLTQKSRSETPLGDVVNHMSSDSDALSEAPMALGDVQATVLSILGAAALLFHYLGATAFLSMGLLFLLAPISRTVARSFSRLDEELMKYRDERVTLMSQILNGIRVVKYFAWEKSVNEEVGRIRAKELGSRKRLARA